MQAYFPTNSNLEAKRETPDKTALTQPQQPQMTFLTSPTRGDETISSLKEALANIFKLTQQNKLLGKNEKSLKEEYEYVSEQYVQTVKDLVYAQTSKDPAAERKHIESYANYLKFIVGLANLCSRWSDHINQLKTTCTNFHKCLLEISSMRISPELKEEVTRRFLELEAMKSTLTQLQQQLQIIQNGVVASMGNQYRKFFVEDPTFRQSIQQPLVKLLDQNGTSYAGPWLAVWKKARKSAQPYSIELIEEANNAIKAAGFEPELIALETLPPAQTFLLQQVYRS